MAPVRGGGFGNARSNESCKGTTLRRESVGTRDGPLTTEASGSEGQAAGHDTGIEQAVQLIAMSSSVEEGIGDDRAGTTDPASNARAAKTPTHLKITMRSGMPVSLSGFSAAKQTAAA